MLCTKGKKIILIFIRFPLYYSLLLFKNNNNKYYSGHAIFDSNKMYNHLKANVKEGYST